MLHFTSFIILAESRKYGRIQLLRKQQHKQKKPVQDSSWKQFKSSDGKHHILNISTSLYRLTI